MAALGIFKIFQSKLVKGFTFMIVPNASATPIRSCRIPFVFILLISGIVLFNILVIIGYSTQVWTIYQYRLKMGAKQDVIAKLEISRKQINTELQQSRQTEKDLIRLKQEQLRLLAVWREVRQKAGFTPEIASRGASVRRELFSINAAPLSVENLTASTTNPDLEMIETHRKLRQNLTRINEGLTQESQAQTKLILELQTYGNRLDHTPSFWPVHTVIISGFGLRFHPIWKKMMGHEGVDIEAAQGSPVRAAAEGVVCFAGWEDGYGNLVAINHGYGYETRYGHNSRLLVTPGQHVKKGQTISYSGNTGVSTGPHLHYEVRINGNPVNPVSYLRR